MMKKLSGIEKVAALISLVGEEGAAKIFNHLDVGDMTKIMAMISNVKVSPHDALGVLREFCDKTDNFVIRGDEEFIERIMVGAFGEEKTTELMGKIEVNESVFDLLKAFEPEMIIQMISKEHPQVIAIVLVHLTPDKAGEVLTMLPEEVRVDVSMRIASLEKISPSMLKELETVLRVQIKNYKGGRKIEGVKKVADIFNRIDGDSETVLLEKIEQSNQDLAEEIKKLMLTFDDLMKIDDKGIQTILKEVSTEELGIALKMADEELKDKIFKNMSQRAVKILKDEMETRGPVKVSDVEAAQANIVAIAKKFEAEGKILIGGKGGEEFVY